MCFAEKCCRYLSLEAGCLLIGGISFVATTAFFILSAIGFFCVSTSIEQIHVVNVTHHHLQTYQLLPDIIHYVNHNTLYVMLGILLCIGVGGMVSSVLLIYGLIKNRSGSVLCFFVYGILLVIFMILGALLELLHMLWILSIIQITVSIIYIHFLVVVHSVYELMQRGKVFGTDRNSVLDGEFENSRIRIDCP